MIEYAARLLPRMAVGLGAPVSVRENPGRLDITATGADEVLRRVVATVVAEAGEPGSIGVIAPTRWCPMSRLPQDSGIDHGVLGSDHGDIDHQVDVVPATVAKGLEFDRVIVVEPAAIAAAEPDERTGLRRLYVVLTRAVSALTVVHSDPRLPSSTPSRPPSDRLPACPRS